jgi:hypothetical protein
LTVVTVAIGWFLPLLGLSPLTFLITDTITGTVNSRATTSTKRTSN